MKIAVEVSLDDCLKTILETAQKRINALDELKAKNVSSDRLLLEIRKGDELSVMRKLGLTDRTVVTLMDMPLADLVNDSRDYYEKVVEHLKEIV
jgi:hypothetical protein